MSTILHHGPIYVYGALKGKTNNQTVKNDQIWQFYDIKRH